MEKYLYIFSGLGADERVFQRLDFGNYHLVFLRWIPPVRLESLADYAKRMAEQITQPNPTLLGLSFGGMIALEVAKLISVRRVVLISSIKTRQELPWYVRVAGTLRLHTLVPVSWMKTPSAIVYWLFGVKESADKELLRTILHDTDTRLLRWSLNTIVEWKHQTLQPHTVHLHGSADRILPLRSLRCNYTLPGGGHLMTLTHARQVNSILRMLLDEEEIA